MILKCSNCGNTFDAQKVVDGELVSCPVCEADYKVLIKDGKVSLHDFVYENEDW